MKYLELSQDEVNMLEELLSEDTEFVNEWEPEIKYMLDNIQEDWRERLLTDIDVMVENGYFDNLNGEETLDRVIKLIKNL